MTATRQQVEAANLTRKRVLSLLAIRKGGTTRAEMQDILDLPRSKIAYLLAHMCDAGLLTKHDDSKRRTPRYTLPGDPLTRTLAPLRANRFAEHERRSACILAALVGRTATKVGLARAAGVEVADRIEGDLRRLRSAGKVEMVGAGVAARYRLPRRIVIGLTNKFNHEEQP
jgi:DNA-binding MarR family transcriptional regulator